MFVWSLKEAEIYKSWLIAEKVYVRTKINVCPLRFAEKKCLITYVHYSRLLNKKIGFIKLAGITRRRTFESFGKMSNNTSPGNDGITKEFYEAFWDDLKAPLLLSVNKAFKVEELSTSQKQAVIKLIEKKKGKGKQLIKNWRPISLLNVDTKLVSRVLSERLKTTLSSLISST